MTDCYETREQRGERKLREAREALDNVVQFKGTWLTDEHAIALREYIAKIEFVKGDKTLEATQ